MNLLRNTEAFMIGWIVAAILTALTIGEYFLAINTHDNLIPLAAFAIAKAALIGYYFMHIYRLWRTEAH